jgi:hypothetical protein
LEDDVKKKNHKKSLTWDAAKRFAKKKKKNHCFGRKASPLGGGDEGPMIDK